MPAKMISESGLKPLSRFGRDDEHDEVLQAARDTAEEQEDETLIQLVARESGRLS